MSKAIVRYVVVESCEDYEQVLALERNAKYPDGGLLVWPEPGVRRHGFTTRGEARAAINRTHHYVEAFGKSGFPLRQFCRIHPIVIGE